MSTVSFLRVTDAMTGVVRLIALGWVASIDVEAQGPVVRLAVPDGTGGLVRVPVRGDVGDLTRQLDGLADVPGLATLEAAVVEAKSLVKPK